MNITHIETIPIRIQKKPSLAIVSSLGSNRNSSTFVIVKIFTDDGIIGLGEVSCDPVWSGDRPARPGRQILQCPPLRASWRALSPER